MTALEALKIKVGFLEKWLCLTVSQLSAPIGTNFIDAMNKDFSEMNKKLEKASEQEGE